MYARPRSDGRSSVVSANDPLAKFYCMNVYLSELEERTWLARGSVKTLRIIEGIPAPLPEGSGQPRAAAAPQLAARRILAEVPIKQDGSFQVTVPASTPIQLQLLDEQGMALRSCGWIWARNHQAQGCIGCHEDPELTPPNRIPLALNDPPDSAIVPVERRITVDFAAQIAPIVASKCVPCHSAADRAAGLDLTGRTDETSSGRCELDSLYQALLEQEPGSPTFGHGEIRSSLPGADQPAGLAHRRPEHLQTVGRSRSRGNWPSPFQPGSTNRSAPSRSRPLSGGSIWERAGSPHRSQQRKQQPGHEHDTRKTYPPLSYRFAHARPGWTLGAGRRAAGAGFHRCD